MRIGVDVHGVITDDPEGFERWLTEQSQVNEVFIVSGPPERDVEIKLQNLGIFRGEHYREIISVIDFLRDSGEKVWEDPPGSGQWWAGDKVWWEAKAKIAYKQDLDILIDDHEKYNNNMPMRTMFILYDGGQMSVKAYGLSGMTLKEREDS
tara:strand:- start:1215 stop:1667 length:453 start_codon:yes stop_codon:yes gene_type:complete